MQLIFCNDRSKIEGEKRLRTAERPNTVTRFDENKPRWQSQRALKTKLWCVVEKCLLHAWIRAAYDSYVFIYLLFKGGG